ncbi:MAG: 2-oxoglutarate dehydrogenase E1 component [Chloroflexi bacterium]|nr:2-oxoglutarate dehydrogenase E1 component [Chloroflexota bacterium]
MAELDQFYGPNAGYVLDLLERYQHDPSQADAAALAALRPSAEVTPSVASVEPDVSAAASAAALAQSIRFYGYLGARLDPLGAPPPGDPQLDAVTHHLNDEDLRRLPASVVGGPLGARLARDASAYDAIGQLRALYCGTSGFDFAHIAEPDERDWLLESIELERFRPPADPVDERGLLDRLTEVSAFERFLQRAYPGQTRFSVEGLGMLIPMLDELIAVAADDGARTIVLGMAHRGRLNVLAHVLGKPYAQILAEFEGRVPGQAGSGADRTDEGWTGDVKYHAGGRRRIRADGVARGSVTVVLAPNPSHLEFVDPVVQGMARAAGEDRRGAQAPEREDRATLGVLIHGDASFPGQGVVAETLNLSRLPAYQTGGTLHIITNNQLGFTTLPSDGRSTLYASDLAKGFEIPIVHVNADDPIACLAGVRLAAAYRARFRKDVLIDLVGYRRWGHNEGDEPSFTQPRLYDRIQHHPTVREQFARGLVERGVLRSGEPEAFLKAGLDEFQRLREAITRSERGREAAPLNPDGAHRASAPPPIGAPSLGRLRELNTALYTFPPDFQVNPKLERAVQRRRSAFDADDALIDWGQAESLALATLVTSGTPVRLTGQDSVRGTFSQRHATFYDGVTGRAFTPLAALPDRSAAVEISNSPLSEAATLGFEYGYSVQAPEALVLWEAQYGDFINGAQVIVDEFVVSGQAKWGLRSGLVLLLPHAWEGQGPDHSGGRLERFLELAAEDNLRICVPSTATQFFHLLRRQAASLRGEPRPLIVFTPKSLLRQPLAQARPTDLAHGEFQAVLDDERTSTAPERVRRVALCSGKIWADLTGDRRRADTADLAVVRVEELYPFPGGRLRAILERYAAAESVSWVQEEPMNMGAWWFVERQLRDLLGRGRELRYIGRPPLASPAEGWLPVHVAEQRRIVAELLDGSREPAEAATPVRAAAE